MSSTAALRGRHSHVDRRRAGSRRQHPRAGLIVGQHAPVVQSAEARIAESLNWRTIRFLLENSVFLFIGLNLSSILTAATRSGLGVGQTVAICLAMLGFLVLERFVWVFLTTLLFRVGPRRFSGRGWSWKNTFAVGFVGIRGVVTLAAVFLLPEETPQKAFLQFLAFVVVVGTLVRGLALPRIVRWLRLPPPNGAQERMEAQMLMAEVRSAGISRLETAATETDNDAVIERLRADAVLSARAEGRYQETAIRTVLAAIDAEEIALRVIGRRIDNEQ